MARFFFLTGFAVPVFFVVNGYFVLNKRSLGYAYVLKKVRSVLITVVVLWVVLCWFAMCLKVRTLVNPLALLSKTLLGTGGLSWFWFFGAVALVQLLSPLMAR